MPLLTWPSKSHVDPKPVNLKLDSIVFPQGFGYPQSIPASHFFLGDNLQIMGSLLEEYQGRLDLIYADPPFLTNKRFLTRTGRGEDSRRPQEWQLAEGYPDHWDSLDAYLDFLYPRLELMYRLLAPHGTLYLHLDWHANSYARLLLDELFGKAQFLNEIIWAYHGPSPVRHAFNRKHDTILVYTKSDSYTFNADAVREPYHPNTIKTFHSSTRAGFGKKPDLERGKVPEDWWYYPVVARLHNERTGYPTQKPEALIERILLVSSNPGDLVADFFCGSGTFPALACRHGRRFLASDISLTAVHTSRKRITSAPHEPFDIFRAPSEKMTFGEIGCRVTAFGQTVSLVDPPALDYWEIDPSWDGHIFRSVMQAWRPNRGSGIPLSIKTPAALTNVCVRAVKEDGIILQSNVQPVSNPANGLQE